jgi:hypothetical protein
MLFSAMHEMDVINGCFEFRAYRGTRSNHKAMEGKAMNKAQSGNKSEKLLKI